MPRHARLILPGVPIHAIQRGVNRAACFFDDKDRDFYLHQLGRLVSEVECALHAYCLMTNHVHLVLTPAHEDSCARLFLRLGLLYAQYVNRKYRRTGTLWEGRFRSCIVQSEIYLLSCHRYVELNPVRAGMVRHPAEYEWSSYAANALGSSASWITPHAEYLKLGVTEAERRHRYRGLFGIHRETELIDEIRTSTNGGYALGTEVFCEEVARSLGRRASPGQAGRPPGSNSPGKAQAKLF